MSKRGRKAGALKKSDRIETMALAGVLAVGYDNLEWWERNFLKMYDEHAEGLITHPDFYKRLEETIKSKWDRQKVFRVKLKLNKKVNRLRGICGK
ncbi:hypothetical protein EH221_07060 [bacterium]|nr:MAG: hypothetical protein EH221_07060 [bacterium]